MMNYDQNKIFGLATVLLLSLALSLPATAQTLVVAKNGRKFGSIQNAIDQATSGDTVVVKEGTYNENLTIDKNLTLKASPDEKVVVQGTIDSYPSIKIGPSEAEVTLKRIHLEGGFRGLYVTGQATVTLNGVVIADNIGYGLGLNNNAQATVTNCTIARNSHEGVVLQDSARVAIQNSEFTGNTGSGINLSNSARAHIQESKVTLNAKGSVIGGGVLLVDTARVSIKRTEISDNRINVKFFDNARGTINNSTVTKGQRGIFLLNSSSISIQDSEIIGNKRAGIWLLNSAEATLQRNKFRENGVGIINYSDRDLLFEKNEMVGNGVHFVGNIQPSIRNELRESTREQITLPDNNYSSLQAAIDALLPGGTITLTGPVEGRAVVSKQLTIKGAREDVKLTPLGDKFAPVLSLIQGADVKLSNVTLTNPLGKGVTLGGNGILRADQSKISGCVFGGLKLSGTTTANLKGVRVEGNLTGFGPWGAIEIVGSSKATIENSTITENKGAAIRVSGSGQVNVANSQITDNEKEALTLFDRAEIILKNNQLTGNGTGIRIRQPGKFTGTIGGSGNRIENNGTDYLGIPDSTQKEITS